MTELLVLGSGGPLVNPRRASSGYVLSTDTGSRVLLDAGGGAFERLGRSGIGASRARPGAARRTCTSITAAGSLRSSSRPSWRAAPRL